MPRCLMSDRRGGVIGWDELVRATSGPGFAVRKAGGVRGEEEERKCVDAVTGGYEKAGNLVGIRPSYRATGVRRTSAEQSKG